MQGVINETHIAISKPLGPFPEDYYYHKIGGYSMIAQAIFDCNKHFIDLFVGLPGSVNDSMVLKRLALYKCAQYHGLFTKSSNDVPPYLLGDKGYPLISWIMTLYKDNIQF